MNIIKDLSKEFSVSQTQLQKLYKYYLRYLKRIDSKGRTTSIYLPKIGKLIINEKYVSKDPTRKKRGYYKSRKKMTCIEIANLAIKYDIVNKLEKADSALTKYCFKATDYISWLLFKEYRYLTIEEVVDNQATIFFDEDREYRNKKEKYLPLFLSGVEHYYGGIRKFKKDMANT